MLQTRDVDIAILPIDQDWPLARELALTSSASGVTGTEVDVVRLDQADPLLGREIARDGMCLFEVAPGEFSAWRARAISEWIEFDETIAPHRKRFLARLRVAP